jgi:hypothetical protein
MTIDDTAIGVTREPARGRYCGASPRGRSPTSENVRIGLHWLHRDGTILRANPAEFERLGYGRDEAATTSSNSVDRAVVDGMLARLSGEPV